MTPTDQRQTHTPTRTDLALDRIWRASHLIDNCDMEHTPDDSHFAFMLQCDVTHLRKEHTALLAALEDIRKACGEIRWGHLNNHTIAVVCDEAIALARGGASDA